jgi:hypothetical protein
MQKQKNERMKQLAEAELKLARLLVTKLTLNEIATKDLHDMMVTHNVTYPDYSNVESIQYEMLEVMIAEQQAEIIRLQADPHRGSMIEARSKLQALAKRQT